MGYTQDTVSNEPPLDVWAKAEQLLDLTHAMLAAAKADAWDEFEVLEPQRRALLEMVFGNQTLEESVKLQLADVVKEIQLIDPVICNLISQRRDQAADELRHLKHAQEGDKAYRIAQDDPL